MQSTTSETGAWGTWPRAIGIAGVIGVGTALGYYCYTRNCAANPEKTKEITLSADDWKKQGNAWFKEKNYTKALECFQKAIEAVGEDSELKSLCYQNCAAVYDIQGDLKSCVNACTEALNINPRYVKALHRRSKCYNKLAAHRESLEDELAACAVEKKPLSAAHCHEILTANAVSAVDERRAKNYRVPISPSRVQTWAYYTFEHDPVISLMKTVTLEDENRLFAECFEKVQNGEVNDLLDLVLPETQKEDSPFLFEALLFAARLNLYHGCLEESHKFVNRCEKLWLNAGEDQKKKWVDHRIAALIMSLELSRDANVRKSLVAEAVALDKTNRDIHIAQALLSLESDNDFEAALTSFEKAKDDQSDGNHCVSCHILFIRGLVAFISSNMAGINDAVLKMESYAEQFGDAYPLVHMFLGRLYSMVDAKDQAIGHFNKAEKRMGSWAELALLKASMELAGQESSTEHSKAIQLLESVIRLDPNYGPTYSVLARVYMQAGEYQKAIEAFDKGLALTSNMQNFFIMNMERIMLGKSLEVSKRLDIPADQVVEIIMGSNRSGGL
uniref:Mitochondrial import receptor subunit TOM70 n=1 Tax=Steinernema glaseri TaxID=37863 RepID=A0A1I7Z2V3_9BILA